MAGAVGIILIILGIFFLIGIVCGIISLIFAVKKKHRIASIVLLLVCWLGMCIPASFTLGTGAFFPEILMVIFSITIIFLAFRK